MSASPAASQRLSHLLALADQGPALRTALAEEVADLLTHWPAGCPTDTRAMFESLLVKCARAADPRARTRLCAQLRADPELSARILPQPPDARTLIAAARSGGDIVPVLAGALGIDEQTAHTILNDKSGAGLALTCKRAGLARAAFSALVMTQHRPGEDFQTLLDCFDSVAAPDTEEPQTEPR